MSELLNKYKELHSLYIDLLVEYHNKHTDYVRKQTRQNTGDLRRVIKQMREVQKEMWDLAQQRMWELRYENRERWKLEKEKKNVSNNSSN